MTKILSACTQQAPYSYDTPQILEYMDHRWLSKIDPAVRKLALKIAKSSDIDSRASVAPIDVVFGDLNFEERNDLYAKATIKMGTEVLKKALTQAQLQPQDLDAIITVSCTGFMIPSMDAYIINELGLRQNILRLPVTEMGCAGGTSGLIYANELVKANPGAKVALISVETPSLTFQKEDLSMENLVSTALFADGASCAILGQSDSLGPQIIDTDMYHFPHSTHLMGYRLQNSGLKIVLDRDVPDSIQSHFQKIFMPFLDRNHLTPETVDHYLFHPGGKKIIDRIETYFSAFAKDISVSKEILKKHGNMSSSTILYILERFMSQPIEKDKTGYMLAFGPGFVAQSILLRWG